MKSLRLPFGGAVFLGSFLLFLVEPIAAKQLLPILGGSAAVWITCLVFFQTALLCAYLYALWLSRHSRWTLHFFFLASAGAAAIAWAVDSFSFESSSDHPIFTVFAALSIWIGLPFVMLGATSPLLQAWWARLQTTGIPYRLFALSNLASLLGLLLYPSVIEPNLSLHLQRVVWVCGFAAFAAISAALTWKVRAATQDSTTRAILSEKAEAPAATQSQASLGVAADGRSDATERSHELPDGQCGGHSASVDSAPCRVSGHACSRLPIPSPAAARHRDPVSDRNAWRPRLHAFSD